MTKAVCCYCGEFKYGAFLPCQKCSSVPETDDQLMLSLAISDHYLDDAALTAVSKDIATGNCPQLDEDSKIALRPSIEEAKRMMGDLPQRKVTKEAKPSWVKKLFGVEKPNAPKPFHTLKTRHAREEWLRTTPPWDKLSSTVVAAIISGFRDDYALEIFVRRSMRSKLVERYAALNEQKNYISINSAIAGMLCDHGKKPTALVLEAVKRSQPLPREDVLAIVDCYDSAIALSPYNLVPYCAMAMLCALDSKPEESQNYAKRGLRQLAKARPEEQFMVQQGVISIGFLDETETVLRSFL